MNRILLYIVCVCFLGAIPVNRAQAQELWTEIALKYDINDNLQAKASFEPRFIDRQGLVNYKNNSNIELEYKISKFLEIGGGYRYSLINTDLASPSDDDLPNDKERYHIEMQFDFNIAKDVEIKNRSRYQIKLVENKDPYRVYRNKTTFEFDIDKKTDFYISDEIFYRFDKRKLALNRIAMGFEYELIKNVEFTSGFYIDLINKFEGLKKNYVLTTGICIDL